MRSLGKKSSKAVTRVLGAELNDCALKAREQAQRRAQKEAPEQPVEQTSVEDSAEDSAEEGDVVEGPVHYLDNAIPADVEQG